ncbi:MAG: SRPBCC family protein [Candidatus Didemnitutus sp.]|nr:SRPBCC family protein [Candidatus Didemnitutus sp.]
MCAQLLREQFIPAEPERVWEFFATPRNLDALTPPDLRIRIVSAVPEKMHPGLLIEYRISPLPGVWLRWLTEIRHIRAGGYFVDEQRVGPYRLWYHEHYFEVAPGGVRMTDRVTYEVGWGPLGWLAERLWVRGELERIFDFRARKVVEIFGPARS